MNIRKLTLVTSATLAVLMATTAYASVPDFTCGIARVYIGQNSANGVVQTDITKSKGVWSVLHTLRNGKIIDRSLQYVMHDATRDGTQQWIGTLLVDPHFTMVGKMGSLPNGQLTYDERQYKDGHLEMHSRALCSANEKEPAPDVTDPAPVSTPKPTPVIDPPTPATPALPIVAPIDSTDSSTNEQVGNSEVPTCNDNNVLASVMDGTIGQARRNAIALVTSHPGPITKEYVRELNAWTSPIENIRQIEYDAGNNTRYCKAQFPNATAKFVGTVDANLVILLAISIHDTSCAHAVEYNISPSLDKPGMANIEWRCTF